MGASSYAAMAAVAAVAVSSAMSPDMPKPATPKQLPTSQTASTPDASKVAGDMSGTGQAGGAPGVSQTMLTGPGGVDPNTLNLGKNSLLGA